mgnify:FL=1
MKDLEIGKETIAWELIDNDKDLEGITTEMIRK